MYNLNTLYIKKLSNEFYILSKNKERNFGNYGVSKTDPYSKYNFNEVEQYYNDHPEMRFEYYKGELEQIAYEEQITLYNTKLEPLQNELNELTNWFNNIYDLQVQQYNRAVRLNLPYDAKYGTIEELDAQAVANSARITELRSEIEELEKTKPVEPIIE